MNIFEPITQLFARLMNFLYYTVAFENYGVAIILFTILTRLALLPLSIKQYQSTAKMQKLQPRLQELQRQYSNDKQRLQEETMKFYQSEKINPMGGCLPLLIQLPIIMSLYPVIQTPLRYLVGKTAEQIASLAEIFRSFTGSTAAVVQEMEIISFFKNTPTALSQAESAGLLRPSELLNMEFLGIELSRTPSYNPDVLFGENMGIYLPLLLIPIISVLATFISGKISMAATAAQSVGNPQAASMNKSMQFIGPVMTLLFSFSLPAGVIVYWTTGYLIQIVQQLIVNKYMFKLKNIFTGEGGVRELPESKDGKAGNEGRTGGTPGDNGVSLDKASAKDAEIIEAGGSEAADSSNNARGAQNEKNIQPHQLQQQNAKSNKKSHSSTSYLGKKK